ncbi:hypothetical protein Pint_25418 [Pistacia integerrima]|uniref:Uncharacterized protein n=1 Tax=Pistacia integerrima TaxID=434235 RepID=A0ACC0YC85_9ROSI|nr:hypothetical protein Pint_25418 [Pistacia integerrima]
MNLRYKEESSSLDHSNEFQGCFDQLSGMGVKFDEDIQGFWLLNTHPDSWENFHVSLTNSVPNGIVTMKYVKSGVLNEEAFVHIPKDERSKFDMKIRQCIFIGYGLDEFGYKLYDPVEKKLVRSRNVVFMEDQTIQDVEKTDNVVPQYSDGLIDLDPVPFIDLPTNVEHDVQDDQQDLDDADVPMQVQIDYQTTNWLLGPEIPLRRSIRDRHPSTQYSANEYVLLIYEGEP